MKPGVGDALMKGGMLAKSSLTLALLSCHALSAQDLIPLGEWRSHFNYDEVFHVTAAGPVIYSASSNAMFSYHQIDNSINRLTRTEGFSDIDISALAFNEPSGWLIIGYGNGNIDLFNGSEIVNLPVITQEPLSGSKRINEIVTMDNLAYLATDFGVVVLDLIKTEIRETYESLGPEGQKLAVFGASILGERLFLTTDSGVLAGNIEGNTNLLDFQNWSRFIGSPVHNEPARFVISTSDKVVVSSADSELFVFGDEQWSALDNNQAGAITNLSAAQNKLFVASEDELISHDLITNENERILYTTNPKPADVLALPDGTLWIADRGSGLFSYKNGSVENFRLTGPATNSTFGLFHHNNIIYALPEGFNAALEPLNDFEGYSTFQNGDWRITTTNAIPFGNLTTFQADPINQELWITSFGDGALKINDRSVLNASTPGSRLEAEGSGSRTTRVTGIDFDSEGNRWLTNYNSSRPLHRIDNQGGWTTFSFNPLSTRFPISLVINDLDDIWMRLSPEEGGGIFVFNAQTDQERLLTTGQGSGDLPHDDVTDITFDLQGQAWIGTVQGIAFFPNPFDIFFEQQGSDAVRPVFENRFLLENEHITAIAIDGGNRKWIGTQNGLWLFEEGGDEVVHQFTRKNSPLPSDNIIDMTINDLTGEVFISTSEGMVSFRADATAGTEKHSKVKVFPNPVRPGFSGAIGISGLAMDAKVKITDIGGRLVREVEANGGTASWDGTDFRGRFATSGIYLILSASPDGSESFVGKIAIVR